MLFYQGKVIWITGASSGIGAGLARAFAKQSALLVLSGRNEQALSDVEKQCVTLGAAKTLILPFDTTDISQLPALVEQVKNWQGCIDMLVNNAGVSQRSLVQDTQLDVYRKVMEIDFFAPVALTKLVLPVMQQQKKGHIVVVSSVAGKIGSKLRSGYCAAKHALHGFFDSLRAESTDQNIQVSLFLPGYVKTNVSQSALTGTGDSHNILDEGQAKAISPDEAAEKVLPKLAKGQFEIYVGSGVEMLAPWLKRFFPTLLAKAIAKQKIPPQSSEQ